MIGFLAFIVVAVVVILLLLGGFSLSCACRYTDPELRERTFNEASDLFGGAIFVAVFGGAILWLISH